MKKKIKETKKDEPFLNKEYAKEKKKEAVEHDLNALYDRANAELALQQSKRDQIISLYLAVFTFLIPFAISLESVSWRIKGMIFLAVAAIGILFSLVVIRYRVYKEAYWLCCQSLTVMMNLREDELDKATVQAIFFQSMYKKGKGYVITDEETGNKSFDKVKYFKKNLFSAETIHFIILAFITASMFGLSFGLVLSLHMIVNVVLGAILGIAVLAGLLSMYFSECCKMYAVLVDDKDSSFNQLFSKAWFLHFYLD